MLVSLFISAKMTGITYASELDEIEARGTLRIITWVGAESWLPREGSPPGAEMDYLQRFADQRGLELELVMQKTFDDLIPALQAGKGDIIAANLSVTPYREKKIAFTLPFARTAEFLVHAKDAKPLKSGKALADRAVVVQKGTTYAVTARGLARANKGMGVDYIPGDMDFEQIMDRVASGEYDLTILDDNQLGSMLSYRNDIVKSLQASVPREIAWGVNKNSKQLKAALDRLLKDEGLVVKPGKKKQTTKSEWDRIKDRGVIRFVMRNNIPSYYIWRGEIMGFHADIARDFAKQHKLRYELVTAPDNLSLLTYLLEDKADVALGFLTPTKVRKIMGLSFSRPYHYASEVLVAHEDDTGIESSADLDGRTISARVSSSYWDTAVKLKKDVPGLNIEPLDETMNTEAIIQQVGQKALDLTIADSHLLDMEINLGEPVKLAMELTGPQAQSWALRKGDDVLLAKVNSYIRKKYKGLFYNVTYNKYFKNMGRMESHRESVRVMQEDGKLSPYDDLVKKYAEKYGFDYMLMVSQMHQESRFNPNAKSYTGARGLFQVMPRTARSIGFKDKKKLLDPETGIHAGIKYMRWVSERFDHYNIPEDELIWFTLAAYNAGSGHVTDAIRLAKQKGWDASKWFDNVERAMLLLSQKKYANKARYGYVRGREPYNYVRQIKYRWEIYQQSVNAGVTLDGNLTHIISTEQVREKS